MTAPARPFWLKPWRVRLLALVLTALAWLVTTTLSGAGFRMADERATDFVWQLTADQTPERRVVIVDIDDASLQRIGPWPWPRETQAKLVRALREQGASLQLHDIVFPDVRAGEAELAREIAQSRATSPVVLAQVFALNNESAQTIGQLAGALPGEGCLPAAAGATGYVANAPGLAATAGHITPRIDNDGAVRRMPAVVCYGQRNYPALAIAGINALDAPGATPLIARPGQGALDPQWSLALSGLPGARVPLDVHGDVRVPFRKSRSAFVSVPAADVLEGKLAGSAVLRGAWVLVGASAFGLGDTVPTALGGAVSGLEVHAQLLTGILDDAVPYTPREAGALSWAWGLGGLALLVLLSWTRHVAGAGPNRAIWIPLAGLGLAALTFLAHAAALVTQGWWFGWSHAAFALALAGLFLGIAEHARSLAEKGRLFSTLASYLPSGVAEKVALAEPSGDIEAERRDVTVVVADVRNFSAFCEARSPEDAAKVLHRFYSTASDIVQRNGGVVEEMVGDRLVAVFNGSQPCTDHPLHALAAARALWLQCTEELPNLTAHGLEPLGLGVGVESGTALLGSFGPAGRRVHSVLGQTITIAMRLQDMTSDLAYPVLVGAETAERVGVPFDNSELALKPLGNFLLAGLRHSTKVFTLRSLLQPGSAADQQSLRYLKLQEHDAA